MEDQQPREKIISSPRRRVRNSSAIPTEFGQCWGVTQWDKASNGPRVHASPLVRRMRYICVCLGTRTQYRLVPNWSTVNSHVVMHVLRDTSGLGHSVTRDEIRDSMCDSNTWKWISLTGSFSDLWWNMWLSMWLKCVKVNQFNWVTQWPMMKYVTQCVTQKRESESVKLIKVHSYSVKQDSNVSQT